MLVKPRKWLWTFLTKHEDHPPFTINIIEVQRIHSFKFLGVTIMSTLKWKDNTCMILKKAHQRLLFLKQLKKSGVSSKGLLQFYRAAVESILTYAVTVWFGNVTVEEEKQLNKVVHTFSEIFKARLQKRGIKILGGV